MNVKDYIEKNFEECKQLLRDFVQIPGPSYHEQQRAQFIQTWLKQIGYDAKIDEKYNVIVDETTQQDDIILVMAHTDTVFNDLKTIELKEDENYIYAPGVGDDGANVILSMMLLKYLKEEQLDLSSYVFVFNVCEEGLGNLNGSRHIYQRYSNRIQQMISFDCYYNEIYNQAVGSIRYKITIQTKGGHSYFDFPEKNAIVEACEMIEQLYHLPYTPIHKTTYNVGIIEGGTSVNTIAQETHFLYEIRSVSDQDLKAMQYEAEKVFTQSKTGVEISFEIIGERPCGKEVDEKMIESMCQKAYHTIQSISNQKITVTSGSTDCNYFLSHSIPSICFGLCLGDGAHTLEEKIEKESLKTGFQIAFHYLFD